jgi:hypothetical protein
MHMCFVFILSRISCLMLVLSCKLYLFCSLFLTAMFPLFFNVLFTHWIIRRRKNWQKFKLTVQIPVVNIYTTCGNVKTPYTLPPQCMYVCRIVLKTRNVYFPKLP